MLKHFNRIILIALAILVVGTVLCIFFAKNMEGNTASMIGGALSAFSTMILGVIAFYQNVLYKQDTDRIYDITLMSDFIWVASFVGAYKNINTSDMPKLHIVPNDEKIQTKVVCGNFLSIHGPICNIIPKALYMDDACIVKEFKEQKPDFSLYVENEAFQIACHIPNEVMQHPHSYTFEMEYENMYGMKYQKKFHYIIVKEPDGDKEKWIVDKAARKNM